MDVVEELVRLVNQSKNQIKPGPQWKSQSRVFGSLETVIFGNVLLMLFTSVLDVLILFVDTQAKT